MSSSLRPHGIYSPWNFPGQNTGVGSLSLLQGIFPTQGLNPGLPHCRQILYQLSHKGSARILEWLAPSPGDLPDPGIELGSPADSLPTELSGKPKEPLKGIMVQNWYALPPFASQAPHSSLSLYHVLSHVPLYSVAWCAIASTDTSATCG